MLDFAYAELYAALIVIMLELITFPWQKSSIIKGVNVQC